MQYYKNDKRKKEREKRYSDREIANLMSSSKHLGKRMTLILKIYAICILSVLSIGIIYFGIYVLNKSIILGAGIIILGICMGKEGINAVYHG